MNNITNTIELEEHLGKQQPKDPYNFARSIECRQEQNLPYIHTILFNKGRYFETSIYNKQHLIEISELITSPIQYNNMIVDTWRKLEDFVIAMNCLGYYVKIQIEWI